MSELADVGYAITNTPLDLEELAEVCYVETTRFLETDFFQLGLFEHNRYRTIICLREGKRVENHEFPISSEDEGIFGWIYRTGQSLLVSDFETEAENLPTRPAYDAPNPPTSGIFVPLIISENVIGILSVQSHEPGFFTQEHLRILTFIANVLSAPIALTLLNYEIDFRKLQLLLIEDVARQLITSDPLDSRLSDTVYLISDTLESFSVAIYEFREDEFLLLASSINDVFVPPLDEDSCQKAISTGISQIRYDVPNTKQEADDPSEFSPLHELCIPLIAEKQVLGLLQLIQRSSPLFSSEHRVQTEIIAANIALAMLESRNRNQQQEENWITTVLLEVARHASQPGNVEESLQAVLQLTTLLTGTSWALLLIPEPGDHEFRLGSSAGLGRQAQFYLSDIKLPLASFGIESASNFRTPVTVDLPQDISQPLQAESAIAIPVLGGKSLLGLFLLEGLQLPDRQMSLIEGIGNQISLRLENSRLVEEIAKKRSLEHELNTARSIQESFLPRTKPYFPGWQVGVNWCVAQQVGGDFYDFIPLDLDEENPRWGIVIADVTDKGIPASLFMALCRTLLRSVSISHIDPGKTLSRLNELIFTDTQADLLISVFYAVWEPKSGRFSYANAGHNPPLLLLPQQPARVLSDHSIVIGAIMDAQYTTNTISINPGELVVLYTDGVTEAMDVEGQMFGLHRLENLVLGLDAWDAQEVADLIAKRVSDFCGTSDWQDDLTTVVLYKPN
jgi:serine phosphatase RsbU (regulator of sigma subunit)